MGWLDKAIIGRVIEALRSLGQCRFQLQNSTLIFCVFIPDETYRSSQDSARFRRPSPYELRVYLSITCRNKARACDEE